MPRIIGKDLDLARRMFAQASEYMGIDCKYYEAYYTESDLYNDTDSRYLPPIDLNIIFDENPKVRVLKDLGWFSEDEEIRPVIAYLPIYKNIERDPLNVVEDSIVEIFHDWERSDSVKSRKFRITVKRMDSTYGNYWICKCAPERVESFKMDLSDGYYYLNINKNILAVDSFTANNEVVSEREIETSDKDIAVDESSAELTVEDIVGIEEKTGVGVRLEDVGEVVGKSVGGISTRDVVDEYSEFIMSGNERR